MKCTREYGGASHVWEVKMQGRGFDLHRRCARRGVGAVGSAGVIAYVGPWRDCSRISTHAAFLHVCDLQVDVARLWDLGSYGSLDRGDLVRDELGSQNR